MKMLLQKGPELLVDCWTQHRLTWFLDVRISPVCLLHDKNKQRRLQREPTSKTGGSSALCNLITEMTSCHFVGSIDWKRVTRSSPDEGLGRGVNKELMGGAVVPPGAV